MDLETIWQQVDDLQKDNIKDTTCSKIKDERVCKECNSSNIIYADSDYLCGDCGLIIPSTNFSTYCYQADEIAKPQSKKHKTDSSKLAKMQSWYMWSNEEKNSYKLKIYTRNLCAKLGIVESLIPTICDMTETVINVIKKHDGTKRARVKDGIIIACIQYVCNDFTHPFNINSILQQLQLDIKYVTRAENIIIELTNTGKLCLNKHQVNYIKNPIEYVQEVIKKNRLSIPQTILIELQNTIQKCEEKDLLLDHTPLSIGVCCFYYILKHHSIDVDIKTFSEMFGLSIVTITKTCNKLSSIIGK